jgi:tRNA(fMet)-specific endonuclease VapC
VERGSGVIYLLDTDTLDHFQRGQANVFRRVNATRQQDLAITIVTRLEILRARIEFVRKAADGAQLRKAQLRLDESEEVLARWQVISFDEAACEQFDRLRMEKRLRKIGRADMLIASIALANGATLVTRNVRDFKLIPGLSVENWVD